MKTPLTFFFLQYAENTIFDPIVFWFSLGFFFFILTPFPLSI